MSTMGKEGHYMAQIEDSGKKDTGVGGRNQCLTRLGFCEAMRRKRDLGHRDVNRGCTCVHTHIYTCTNTHAHRETQNGTKDVSGFELLPEAKYPKLNASVD